MTQFNPNVDRSVQVQRLTLFIGFGCLLLLMALEAYRASRTLSQIQRVNSEVRKEMLRRDDILDSLRTDFFRSSTQIRDFLLDSDPQLAEAQRTELEKLRGEIGLKFQQVMNGLEPEEASSVRELQQRLTNYWNVLEEVVHWTPDYRRTHGNEILQQDIIPQRQRLVELIDQTTTIDAKQIRAGQDRIDAVSADFARSLKEGSLLIIGIGLLVGFLSIRQIVHLERISQNHYLQVVQARGELRLLNARLVASEEEERRKIARELHDQVGQHLAAVLIELGNVESRLPRKDPELQRRMLSARRLAEGSIAKVRDLALLLRPSMLDDLGLVAALKWHAREVSRRAGIQVEVTTDGVSEELPNEYRICIYRVVQEAINNSVRHAKPTLVRVTARQRPEEIQVTVQDNGTGFNPQHDKGLGVLGMQERIQGLGGVLDISSEPGSGTIVSILLPLDRSVPTGAVDEPDSDSACR